MPSDIQSQIKNITSPSATSTTSNGADNSSFMKAVSDRLLQQSDVISSLDTDIESTFDKAITGAQDAADANRARLESQFGRELGYATREAGYNLTDAREQGTGGGMQMTAFRRLVETTDKELKDLEQRKQELILQGDAESAKTIANLQVQQLQFRQQAQQNVFSNLLGLGNFGMQQQQQNLAERKFGLDQQQFQLSGVQLAMQASNSAFDRIGKLQDMGALSAISDAEKSSLASQAGLPLEAVKSIASVPPQQEIRAVGDTLIAVDPRTLKATVLYNGGSDSSGGAVSLGGGATTSFLTASVMNGLQKLEDLTPTQRSTVTQEMTKLGFGSDTVPKWFRDRVVGPQGDAGLVTTDNSLVRDEWEKYKNNIILGPQFLNNTFFKQVFSQDQIKAGAKAAGTTPDNYTNYLNGVVSTYRQAGFTDQEILKMMQSK